MEKIKKTSKSIERVLSVLFWIVAVFSALGVVSFIVILVKGEALPAGTSASITLGNFKVQLADASDIHLQPITLITTVNVALAGLFSCYAIHVLRQIFHPMAQGLPFNGSVSRSIRKIAWVQLIYGIVGVVVQLITNVVFYRSIDIASLFDPKKVSSCTLSVVSDGSFLIWFVLLMLLSHVFRYGEELQQLSDETL